MTKILTVEILIAGSCSPLSVNGRESIKTLTHTRLAVYHDGPNALYD